MHARLVNRGVWHGGRALRAPYTPLTTPSLTVTLVVLGAGTSTGKKGNASSLNQQSPSSPLCCCRLSNVLYWPSTPSVSQHPDAAFRGSGVWVCCRVYGVFPWDTFYLPLPTASLSCRRISGAHTSKKVPVGLPYSLRDLWATLPSLPHYTPEG